MKNILIVGVCGGMGAATANKFLEQGYRVYGLDVKDSFVDNRLTYFKCDITSEENIKKVYESISQEIDNLYAIISVAGIYRMDSLLEIEDEKIKQILDINALGIYRIVKIFFPLLKKNSRVLIASSEVAPLDPLPFNGIYSISKALVEKYAFSLRMELNLFDIKVILLRPGAVETPLLGDSMSELDKMCNKTTVHKDTSKKFKKIVDSVESKSIKPEKVGRKIYKIINKKKPKYVYKINNNFLLKLLNAMPDRFQVWVITKLLRKK